MGGFIPRIKRVPTIFPHSKALIVTKNEVSTGTPSPPFSSWTPPGSATDFCQIFALNDIFFLYSVPPLPKEQLKDLMILQ